MGARMRAISFVYCSKEQRDAHKYDEIVSKLEKVAKSLYDMREFGVKKTTVSIDNYLCEIEQASAFGINSDDLCVYEVNLFDTNNINVYFGSTVVFDVNKLL